MAAGLPLSDVAPDVTQGALAVIEFHCPACGVALSVPDNEGGQQYECLCGQLVLTPARTGEPARLVPVQRGSGAGTSALWILGLVLFILGVACWAGY
jgi:hypothetical protein